jgi:type II secretory pathway component PulF
MKQDLTFKIKNAAFDFKDKRGNFYLDLASVMEASPGESITKILARYAERYKKRSVGVLCRHWLDRFAQVGTFTEALRGTVPAEDMAALAASESSGDLRLGLEKLGANILAMQETRKEISKLMVSAVVMVFVLHGYLALQSFLVMPKLEKAVRGAGVELSQLGRGGAVLFGGAEFIRSWWWVWLILVVGGVLLVTWAVKHYVGKYRRWLDDHFLPFQMARDFNSAAFFATVGMLTTARNNNVIQLHDALLQTKANAYPWLKWQTTKLLENLAATPNGKGEIFNTGIANETMYYRILDISDHSDVPVMLKKVGEIILKTAPQEIKAKAGTVRVVLMALCLVTMLGTYASTISLVEVFKAAVTMKAMLH